MGAVQHPLDTGGQMQGALLLKGLECLPHGGGNRDEEASDEVICCLHVCSAGHPCQLEPLEPQHLHTALWTRCPTEAGLPGPLSSKGQAVLWTASLGFY